MARGIAAMGIVATLICAAPALWPTSEGDTLYGQSALASGKACKNGPLKNPRANCAPPVLPSSGDLQADCVRRINQLRWKCQCLPPLTRWKGGEKCARQQAKHDSRTGIHAGFNARVCEPIGYAQNECPAWPSKGKIVDGCLQAMWDEGPGRRFSKHGHYINMSSLEYDSVACGFYVTPDGQVWSVQNFR